MLCSLRAVIYRASIIAYAIVNIVQSVAVMVYGVNLVPTIISVSQGFLSFVARSVMLGPVIAELSFSVALLERGIDAYAHARQPGASWSLPLASAWRGC